MGKDDEDVLRPGEELKRREKRQMLQEILVTSHVHEHCGKSRNAELD